MSDDGTSRSRLTERPASQKIAAMRAHATQITPDGPFRWRRGNTAVLGREYYRLAVGVPLPRAKAGLTTCSPG